MNFGEMLLVFRAEHELTQTKAAQILGTRQEDISRYEKGDREPTRVKRIIFEKRMKEYEKECGENEIHD